MFRWLTYISFYYCLTHIFICFTAQGQSLVSADDTTQIIRLNLQAQKSLLAKQSLLALQQAKQALQLAQKTKYITGKANSLFILGKISQRHKKFGTSLNYFLRAKALYEQLKKPKDIAWVYYETGNLYLLWQSPKKSLTYLTKSHQIILSGRITPRLRRKVLDKTGDAYQQMGQFNKASATYQELIQLQQGFQLVKERLTTLKKLARIHTHTKSYNVALAYEKLILGTQENIESLVEKAATLNNIGFLYKKLKQQEEAIHSFQESLKLYKAQHKQYEIKGYENYCAILLTNIGITYNLLQNPQEAQRHFSEALEFRKQENNQVEIARLHNLIATNYCIQNRPEKAQKSLNHAIAIAENEQNKEVLQNSYKVFIRIYEQQQMPHKVKIYYKLLVQLKEEIEIENRQKLKVLYNQQLAIDKKETDYRLLLAEEEKQASLNRQLQLESEQKEQTLALKASELSLLRKDQELQQSVLANELLEKSKVKQLLSLAEQRLYTEEQRLLIDSLHTNKKLQQLALERQKAKDKERQQRIALLEKDKRILKEEQTLRRYTLIGAGILLILVLVVVYQTHKHNKNLKLRNAMIKKHQQESQQFANRLMKINERLKNNEKKLKVTNTKLEQQYFEIKAHNFILSDTIDELGRKNQHIQDSLYYAQRMQNAMLPYKAEMAAVFQEHFVIFKPREIVSGDFYWFASVTPKKVKLTAPQPSPTLLFAVVDCTGHGVPGGFLSMMGFALLNEIVHIEKVLAPAKILQRLDTELRQSLKQENSKNNDGMDVCFCTLENTSENTSKLTFAGAKRPLYYTLPQYPNELQQFPANRHSIGGKKKEKVFEEQTIEVSKGTCLYLSTDGLIHVPNPQRRNFGSRRFKQTLAQYAHLPLAEQQEGILNTLREFQQSEEEQRDDVTLVGVKV